MSTSEPKSGGSQADGLPALAASAPLGADVPVGLPDLQLMAAMANQLFRAGLPGLPEGAGGSSPAGLPARPALPAAATAGSSLPGGADARRGAAAVLPGGSSSPAFADAQRALSAPAAQATTWPFTAEARRATGAASPSGVPSFSEAPRRIASGALEQPRSPLAPELQRSANTPSELYFVEQALARQSGAPAPATSALPRDPASLGGVPNTSAVSGTALPHASAAPYNAAASQGLPTRAGGGNPLPAPALPYTSVLRGFDFPQLQRVDVLERRQFDVQAIRRDFPILREVINGRELVWLDNAATTQKPQAVIDRIAHFYAHENSNIHRAAHDLAARATDAYEDARESVRRFVNAPSPADIVFVRGTTEAINLVAQAWGRRNIRAGDEIIISWLEHHSNIVPWQLLCAETGARLRVAPVDDCGQIRLDEYERLFGPRTRLVSFTHVSNALGSVLPAKEMIEIAHRHGARVLVDGAQSVSHMRVDVQALDCDFYAFSGHKVFGPTGIGALYGKSDVLQHMPPWQGGGNMIVDVTFDKTVYAPAPGRFEAGTGNIADAVGLGAALEYVEQIGIENIARHEHELLEYGTERLLQIPRLRLIGTAKEKAGVLGFVIDGIPTEQVGAALAKRGIAVRSGHHCAQPALRRYGLEATVRPSLAVYNTHGDIDRLIETLQDLQSGWPRY